MCIQIIYLILQSDKIYIYIYIYIYMFLAKISRLIAITVPLTNKTIDRFILVRIVDRPVPADS